MNPASRPSGAIRGRLTSGRRGALLLGAALVFLFGFESGSVSSAANGPGGVSGGLQLWLRADAGVTAAGSSVTVWGDQTGGAHDALQAVPANRPVSVANGINFNPAVRFDGADDYLDVAHGLGLSKTAPFTVVGMGTRQSVGTWDAFLAQPGAQTNDLFFGYASTNKVAVGASGISGLYGLGTYGNANVPRFISTTRSGNVFNHYRNGAADGGATAAYSFNVDTIRVGNRLASADLAFHGLIGEVIVFNRTLPAAELQQVHSYLALKYGVTLDQSAPTSYLASNGDTFWDAAANGAFKNDVAGIGRDDASGLDQRQSASVNAGNILTVGHAGIASTNATNPNEFESDQSFLVWAHDNGRLTQTTPVAGTTPALTRLGRLWRVQESGSVGSVRLRIPVAALAGSSPTLVRSPDALVTSADTLVPLTQNGVFFEASIDFSSGDYFTFAAASATVGPGGVAGATLWLRADRGTSSIVNGARLTGWVDNTATANDAAQATDANQPTYRSSASESLNFNPTVRFDGTDDFMGLTAAKLPTGTSARTFAAVGSLASIGTPNKYAIGWGTAATSQGMGLASTAGTGVGHLVGYGNDLSTPGFWKPNIVNELMATWAGAGGQANLFSKTKAVATPANKAWNTGTAGARVGSSPWGLESWNGWLGEVIVYPRALDADERQRMSSYLALKYGHTLDQTVPTNYLASDGTVIWNAAANAGYRHDVAGIGRDDSSDLNQKQSDSANPGSVLGIALGSFAVSNPANANSFPNDRSFLVWGHNGATVGQTTPVGATSLRRYGRIWLVQETQPVGSVRVRVPVSALQGPGPVLLRSEDDVFDGTDEVVPLAQVGANLEGTIDLENGDYLTFASEAVTPGGVSGASLWLRADRNLTSVGSSVSGWRDLVGDFAFAQDGTTALPIAETANASFNFNPSLDFGSGSRLFASGVGSLVSTGAFDTYSMFAAVAKEGNGQRFFVTRNSGTNQYTLESAQGGRSGAQIEYRAGVVPANGPALVGVTYDGTAPNRRGYVDGRVTVDAATAIVTGSLPTAGTAAVGGGYGGTNWTGHVGEVIVFDRQLTPSETARINSYLAMKYGRTLDQTTPTTYVDSTGAVVWDPTANSAYDSDIAAIGRDDATGLSQKQSGSVNAGNGLFVGLGTIAATNLANDATFPLDGSFLAWGHNAGSLEVSTAIPGSATLRRMARVWKVQETGTVGTVTVRIRASDLGAASVAQGPPYLVRSHDQAIGSDDDLVQLSAVGANYEATIDLADGDYFTFAAAVPAPGGVPGGLQLWLRADDGPEVNTQGNATIWNDRSQYLRNANVVVGDPQRIANAYNFNPTLRFDGDGDAFRFTPGGFASAFTAGEVVALLKNGTSGCNCAHAFDFGSGSRGSTYTWSTGAIYDGFGTTDRLGWNPTTKAIVDSKPGVASITGPAVTTQLPHIYNVGSATNNWHAGFDGVAAASSANNATSFGLTANKEYVGGTGNGNFNGDVAEIVLYNRKLTTAERQRVASYYALKYGITLPGQSYVDSTGAAIWTTGGGYDADVAGIGRDDASDLDQRQSASVNAGNVLTIGNGTIAADNGSNPNGFGTDRSFLVWGHNNGTLEQVSVLAGTSPALTRVNRIWKAEERGAVGQVLVRVAKSALRGRPRPALVRSTDATFDGTDTIVPMTVDGTSYEAPIDFTTGDFFTFASLVPAPGGVATGLHFWYRGDGYSPVTAANNLTGLDDETGRYASAWGVAGDPQRIANGLNFNPVVSFDGTDWIGRNDGQSGSFTAAEKFVVARQAQAFAGNNGIPFRFGESTAATGNSHHVYGNGYYYNDFCTSERKAWHPSTKAVAEGAGTTSGPAVNNKQWHVLGMRSRPNEWVHDFDGVAAYTDATTPFNCAGTLVYLGAHEGFPYYGDAAEAFVYSRVLTADERVRVNTYLALKYGLTLGSAATPISYRASDGTIVWSGSATYHRDVAGIGRDDFSGLDQRQSASANTGNILTVGHGGIAASNAANPNPFAADRSLLVWGHDGGTTSASIPVVGAATPLNRMGRIWKVEKTGSPGPVALRTPVSTLAGRDPAVIWSADPTFDGSDLVTPMARLGSNYEATVTLETGYFTFAAEPVGPGGVTIGLQLWLKANQGLEVNELDNATGWFDQGLNGRNANVVVSDPQLVADALNFNPVARFDGNDYFRFSSSPFANASTQGQVFSVLRDGAYTACGCGGSFDFGSGSRHSVYTWTNGGVYEGFGTTDRFGWDPLTKQILDTKPGVAAIAGPAVDPRDYNIYHVAAAPNDWAIGFNGTAAATTATNTTGFALTTGNEHVGAVSGFVFNGDIAETILFNRKLDAAEQARVNSYLALKYGITLDQTTGGQSYVASDGVAVWDNAFDPDGAGPLTSGTFANDIAGIARDDGSSLDQPRSRSINPDAVLTLADPTSADHGDFLVWGNDGDGAAAWGTSGAGGVPENYRRIPRTWSVQAREDIGSATVSVDVADPDLDLPAPIYDYFVVHDSDGDNDLSDETPVQLFDDGTHGDEVEGDNLFSAEGVSLANGAELTVATFIGYDLSGRLVDAPGGAGLNGRKVSLLLDGGAKVTVTTATNAAGGGQSGEFLFAGVDARATSTVTLFIDDEVEKGVLLTRDAEADASGLELVQNHLVVRNEDTGSITNENVWTGGDFAGTPDADVTAILGLDAASGGTLSTAPGVTLRVTGGATYAPGGFLDLAGDLVISPGATLEAGELIALQGDWIDLGTFAAAAGAVVLDGGDQAITGTTTFHHLTKVEASDDGSSTTLTIDDAGIGVTGTLTLDGVDANDVLLVRSDTPGSAATITFSGAEAAEAIGDHLDVRDSALENGPEAAVPFPVAPANSFDRGNTTNWFDLLLVEFSDAVAGDDEAAGANLPALLVSGHGTSDARSIDVVVAGGTATPGDDFTFDAPLTVAIPPGDYTTAQTIAFPGPAIVDDGLLEAAESVVLGLATPAPGVAAGDADGADGSETEHTYTIADDEAAVVEFENPSSTSADELTGPTVNLRSTIEATAGAPGIASGVTVPVDVSYDAASTATLGADISFSDLTVTFTDADASGALRPIPYSLLGDAVIEGDESAVLAVTPNDSGTVVPTIGANAGHTITITDDDVPGVSVFQSGGQTLVEEGGAGDALSVRLTAQPAANVSVAFTADGGELAPLETRTFTPGDWDVPQLLAVEALDDPLIEGAHSDDIDYATSSADPAFHGITGDDVVTVAIADDDTAGAVVTISDDVTSEDGETGAFQIALTARPSAPVTIALSSSNADEVSVPTSITIAPADWNVPEANVVTVTGVDDSPPVGDGAQPVTIVTGDVTSADPSFDTLDGTTIDDVTVYNENNDPPGIAVQVVDGTSDEPGAAAVVRFRLLSQPIGGADVTIPLAVSDGTEASLGTSAVTIANADWNNPAANEVTITGLDDALDDGDVVYQLATGDPSSLDAGYDGLVAADVVDPSLTNVDDDVPGVSIVETGGSTEVVENGASDVVEIVLASQPAPGRVVVVTVSPHPQIDAGAGPGAPFQVTFANADWNVPHQVAIAAADDARLEGAHAALVSYAIDAGATTEDGYDSVTGLPSSSVAITDDETAVVSVAPGATGREAPAAPASLDVSLSRQNDTGAPVAVSYTWSGTATAGPGGDYALLSGSVAIPNGESEATVQVDTAGFDDGLLEGPETVIVTLTGTDHAAVSVDGAANEAAATILDDETATAVLSVEANGNEEDPAGAAFRVTLSQPNETGVPISFAIDPSGGTATAGEDYTDFAGGEIAVPAGATSGTFEVEILDDAVFEDEETLEATISAASLSTITIATPTAGAAIEDNETAMASVVAEDSIAAENPSEEGRFRIVLSSRNETGAPIAVTYDVTGTASAGGDYAPLSGTVTVPDGQTGASVSVDTTGRDDALLEGQETVVVSVTGVDHPAVSVDPQADEATVTIADDETATATFSVVADGDEEGPANLGFEVTISKQNDSGAPITFAVDSSGGAALAGSDYESLGESVVSIPAGASSGSLTVDVLDDALLESSESVELTISDPSLANVQIVAGTATATIADDDTATVSVLADDADAAESPADAGTFRVSLSKQNDTAAPIQVAYSVGGTAAAGSDYVGLSGTVAVPAGQTGATVTADTTGFDDALAEGPETVVLTLQGTDTPAVTLGNPASAALSIADDDVPGVTVVQSGGSTSVAEGGAVDSLTLRLTAQPDAPVSIALSSDEGQLVAADPLVFAASNWNVPQGFVVKAVDDPVVEGPHDDRIDYAATSADLDFGGLSGDDVVTVEIGDDDVAGAVVSVVDDLTSEDGSTASFEIELTARPTAPVTLALSSSDTSEASVPASITIDPADWNVPEANVVTVTGVDDSPPVGDGAQPVTIATGDVTSGDVDFDLLDGSEIDDVTVHNENNDPPGVAVEVVDGTSEEPGAAAVVRFRLLSQPIGGADVTIPLAVSDGTEASLGTSAVTIANADWNNPAANEVTVAGVDDFLDDGGVLYKLETGDPTSSDAGYDGLVAADAADPSLTNADDDVPAVTVAESEGSTTVAEGGASDTVSLALASQPAPGKQVVVTVTPHVQVSAGAGPGTPVQVVFDDSDWAAPHEITIAAVDDLRLEGDHAAVLSHAIDAAATSEEGYKSLADPPPTGVQITDDDAALVSVVADDADAAENPADGGSFLVGLSRQNDTGGPITVSYTVAGTATHNGDYTALAGSVDIPAGQTSSAVAVETGGRDDSGSEGDETVVVTLVGTSNSLVSSAAPTEAAVTIADDEPTVPLALNVVPSGVVVLGLRSGTVTCRLTGDLMSSCAIDIRTRTNRRIAIGSTSVATPSEALTVRVQTTTLGRRVLRALGGVRAIVRITARSTAHPTLTANVPRRAVRNQERFVTPRGSWRPNRSILTPRGRRFVRSLRPKLVAVRGVTCVGYAAANEGSRARARRLSRARARVMCARLRGLGIAAPMRIVGNGRTRPIASNATVTGRAKNRRVVVLLRH